MADTQEDPTGLGDLPEACICAILSCLSAQDVLRASSVNSTFAAAASSDCVWQALLPGGYEEAVERAQWGRPSPYEAAPLHASQEPAVQQIMGHLINGVPGGRGRFRGRPLLLVPTLSRAGPQNAEQGPGTSAASANDTSPIAVHQQSLSSTPGVNAPSQDLQDAPGPPDAPKDLFQKLARGVLLGEAGLESFKIDVRTMGVERMFSALDISITWGSDERYWRRSPGHGSRFGASMLLMNVCWLEARFLRRIILPPGEYSILWRLAIRRSGPWTHPVQFSVTTGNGTVVTKSQSFAYGDFPVRPIETQQWTELEVGTITVAPNEVEYALGEARQSPGLPSRKGVEVELDCVVRGIEGGNWKSGLDLDCLIIRPKVVEPPVADPPIGRPAVGGLRSLAARAPEPLAELAETAADMGSRFLRWISQRPSG